MLLMYDNPNITLNCPEKVSNLLGCVVYYEAYHWIEGISGMTIKAGNNGFISKCATIMNAYSDYCDLCNENKIETPENLSVWMVSGTGGACTPLTRHVTGTALPSVSNSITDFLGILLVSPDRAIIPDIIIGTDNAINEDLTEDIYSNMFHELSHASHYFGLGPEGRKLWFQEYGDMISGWIEVKKNGGNPFENCYNDGGTDLVRLIESWGYFSGNYLMSLKYPKTSFNWNKIPIIYLDILENRKLDYDNNGNIVKSLPYFYYGGLYDLIDTENETDIDFTGGYTYNQLFKALVSSSNVNDLESYALSLVEISNRQSDLPNVFKTLQANHK